MEFWTQGDAIVMPGMHSKRGFDAELGNASDFSPERSSLRGDRPVALSTLSLGPTLSDKLSVARPRDRSGRVEKRRGGTDASPVAPSDRTVPPTEASPPIAPPVLGSSCDAPIDEWQATGEVNGSIATCELMGGHRGSVASRAFARGRKTETRPGPGHPCDTTRRLGSIER